MGEGNGICRCGFFFKFQLAGGGGYPLPLAEPLGVFYLIFCVLLCKTPSSGDQIGDSGVKKSGVENSLSWLWVGVGLGGDENKRTESK